MPSLSPDRLIQQTTTMIYKNPQLAKCECAEHLLGMVQAAELGLELAGPLGKRGWFPGGTAKRNARRPRSRLATRVTSPWPFVRRWSSGSRHEWSTPTITSRSVWPRPEH